MTHVSLLQYYCHSFFFFNDTATTEIYTLSLHDALPISGRGGGRRRLRDDATDLELPAAHCFHSAAVGGRVEEVRSEEHTSELQSPMYLVCRLLLEKKKTKDKTRRVRRITSHTQED